MSGEYSKTRENEGNLDKVLHTSHIIWYIELKLDGVDWWSMVWAICQMFPTKDQALDKISFFVDNLNH